MSLGRLADRCARVLVASALMSALVVSAALAATSKPAGNGTYGTVSTPGAPSDLAN